MAVKATAKTVDISQFKKRFTRAAQESRQDQLNETLDKVLEGVMKSLNEIKSNWSGGEDFKKKEVELLRKRGLSKLADKRSHRPTWPDLDFEVKRGFKNGAAWATISTDNPLFIWLDRGTDGVSDSPKVFIVPVTVRGTIPGVRKVNPTTVAKRPVLVQEHTSISGIDPNNWSKGIADEVNSQYNLMSNGHGAVKVKVEVPK